MPLGVQRGMKGQTASCVIKENGLFSQCLARTRLTHFQSPHAHRGDGKKWGERFLKTSFLVDDQ